MLPEASSDLLSDTELSYVVFGTPCSHLPLTISQANSEGRRQTQGLPFEAFPPFRARHVDQACIFALAVFDDFLRLVAVGSCSTISDSACGDEGSLRFFLLMGLKDDAK